MPMVDFFSRLSYWWSVFAGAFDYRIVNLVCIFCLAIGAIALYFALSRNIHDNTQSKRVVMGCIAIVAITIALGMWFASDRIAENQALSGNSSPILIN